MRNARKPASEARPKTRAGCRRVNSDAVRTRSSTVCPRMSRENCSTRSAAPRARPASWGAFGPRLSAAQCTDRATWPARSETLETCMLRKPLAFWLARGARETAASFAWLPACCAASVTFEMASPALARMSCATPDAVGWFSGRDDGDVELLGEDGY